MGMDNSTMPGMVFTVTTTTISTWVWTIQRCLGWCSRSLLLRSLHGYGQFNDAWDGVHGHYYYDLYMGSWSVVNSLDPDNSNKKRKWVTYPIQSNGNEVSD